MAVADAKKLKNRKELSYQLIYFNIRGKAEAIRLLLEDHQLPYENVKIDNWKELKSQMIFGQVPCFRDGDLELVQTCAILRYLARKHNLYGENDLEKTMIDMINDGQEDLRMKYLRMIYQNYEDGKDVFIKELPTHLEKFERLLKKNEANCSKGFFVGNKISFLDYNMFDLLDILLALSTSCLDEFPTLKGYYNKIHSRENIMKHRATDYFQSLKINGNGKQ